VLVGTGSTKFETTTISKAIYATGWDGSIILEATSAGRWVNLAEEAISIVNINTATFEELKGLPYLGETRAQAILNYRQTHGNFTSIEDLDNVPGIGPGTIVRLKDRIKV
jgi:comEA protein